MALAVSASSAHAASTRAEYIAQVDPICAAANVAAKRTLGGVGHDLQRGRFKRAARKFERTNAVFTNAVEQVASVPPPAADAALISQWIGMLRAQAPLADRVAKVLHRNARLRTINRALRRLFSLSDRTKELVAGYGFSSCQYL